jgi:hypothetical protein
MGSAGGTVFLASVFPMDSLFDEPKLNPSP